MGREDLVRMLRDRDDEIERLREAIIRYLAGDYSCNGGAERLFREALGNDR